MNKNKKSRLNVRVWRKPTVQSFLKDVRASKSIKFKVTKKESMYEVRLVSNNKLVFSAMNGYNSYLVRVHDNFLPENN